MKNKTIKMWQKLFVILMAVFLITITGNLTAQAALTDTYTTLNKATTLKATNLNSTTGKRYNYIVDQSLGDNTTIYCPITLKAGGVSIKTTSKLMWNPQRKPICMLSNSHMTRNSLYHLINITTNCQRAPTTYA
ncbi:MAG: hypothetical protein K6E13_09560 [Lachnospiraceae bacterium]|nr:hypothetical protein [Lachnospiraceae bacterium]